MKPNPVPLENASLKDQIEFLKTHIENQDEEIARLEEMAIANETAKQQRAWAIDIASRFFDKTQEPDFARIETLAKQINDYVEGTKQ